MTREPRDRPRWDAESRQWFDDQEKQYTARMANVDQDVARIRGVLDRAAANPKGDTLAVVLAAEMVRPDDPATFRHLAAAYALQTRVRQAELDELAAMTAKLRLHTESVQLMRGHLLNLGRWHWIRRRRIEHQLALTAIAITRDIKDGEDL